MYFRIQLIYFHTLESASRDNTYNLPALDHREMTKAELIHLSQRVDSAAIGTDRDWIGRHRLRQGGNLSLLSLSKRAYRISAGENARQTLLIVHHQNRACAAVTHASAGLLDRRMLGEYLQLLALDDILYLSVGHGRFSRMRFLNSHFYGQILHESARAPTPRSILVINGASVPVDLEPLHKRVVDGYDVGSDGSVVCLNVPDLQPLVVEPIELRGEIAAHVFG